MSGASIANPTSGEIAPQENYIQRSVREAAERRAVYVQLLGQGWGKREAARKAGYKAVKARHPVTHIETSELKAEMQLALKRQGATYDKAARVVSEAMNATVSATFEGEVTTSDVPDHKVRVQAARVTADLMGLTERSAGNQTASSITLTLAGPLAERFAQMLGSQPVTVDAEVDDE